MRHEASLIRHVERNLWVDRTIGRTWRSPVYQTLKHRHYRWWTSYSPLPRPCAEAYFFVSVRFLGNFVSLTVSTIVYTGVPDPFRIGPVAACKADFPPSWSEESNSLGRRLCFSGTVFEWWDYSIPSDLRGRPNGRTVFDRWDIPTSRESLRN